MEKWGVKLLVILAIVYEKAHSFDARSPEAARLFVDKRQSPLRVASLVLDHIGYPEWFKGYQKLTIDCGLETTTEFWPRLDKEFMKTGQNKQISTRMIPEEMNTLRFFPNDDKNCYQLPLEKQQKYLIRAGFYYGNYDGLSKPPTFDLQIDGKLWVTASTSRSEEPVYHEIIYPITKDKKLSLCLVRTRNEEVPFISSLEATILPGDFYRLMDNYTAMNLQNRNHFGYRNSFGNKNREIGKPLIATDREDYNRYWKPREMPSYQNNCSSFIPYGVAEAENQPPYTVVECAIESQNTSDSIFMWIDFPVRTQFSAYFVFYFKELDRWSNVEQGMRKMHIYIDSQEKDIIEVPQNKTCKVVSQFPVTVVGPANVTISSVWDSTLPPILNALEVYTAIDLSKGEHLRYYSFLLLISLHVLGVVLAF